MPFKIRAKIDGLSDVTERLKNIDKGIRKKALRKACGAAGTIILKAAKARARKDTGLLRKSLGKKVKVYSSGVGVAVIGPRLGFRQTVKRGGREMTANPVKYAHLVELGTRHSPAYPFLSSAIDATRAQVRDAMSEAILEVIEGAAK